MASALALHNTTYMSHLIGSSPQQLHAVGIPVGIRLLERNMSTTRDSNLGLAEPNQDLYSTLNTFCRETNLVEEMEKVGMGMTPQGGEKNKEKD